MPTTHRIRWFVYGGPNNSEQIPHNSTMRGQWGYDVKCSCGWETHTGGAVKRFVSDEVWYHKWQVAA